MLTFAQVLELAETWVRVVTQDQAVLMPEHTVTRPYGWVFLYQSRAYLASRDRRDMILGNAPILIDRVQGGIRLFDTGRPLEDCLAEYEAGIPRSWKKLHLPPEATP